MYDHDDLVNMIRNLEERVEALERERDERAKLKRRTDAACRAMMRQLNELDALDAKGEEE